MAVKKSRRETAKVQYQNDVENHRFDFSQLQYC